MSSTAFSVLQLDIPRLRWQHAMACAALCACAGAPWLLTEQAMEIRLALASIATAICAAGLRHARWWPSGARIVAIGRQGPTRWQLTSNEPAEPLQRELHGSSRCFRQFIWLRFAGGPSLFIGPGDVDPDQFRRLQVALRYPGIAPVSERVA